MENDIRQTVLKYFAEDSISAINVTANRIIVTLQNTQEDVKKADQLHILLNGAQELLNIFHFIASNHMAKCHSMAILRIIAHKRRIGKTMTAKTSKMKQI